MQKQKLLNGSKILWVEYWIKQAHPSCGDYEISAKRIGDNVWASEISLPLIHKTAVGVSSTKIKAMMEAANEASKEIKKYMKHHKEINIKNDFKNKPYEIHLDDNGEIVQISINSKYRKRESRKYYNQITESTKALQKVVKKVKKLLELNKGLMIQIVDKSIYEKNEASSEISIWESYEKVCGCSIIGLNNVVDGESAICIGCVLSTKKEGELK